MLKAKNTCSKAKNTCDTSNGEIESSNASKRFRAVAITFMMVKNKTCATWITQKETKWDRSPSRKTFFLTLMRFLVDFLASVCVPRCGTTLRGSIWVRAVEAFLFVLMIVECIATETSVHFILTCLVFKHFWNKYGDYLGIALFRNCEKDDEITCSFNNEIKVKY